MVREAGEEKGVVNGEMSQGRQEEGMASIG